MRVTVTALRRPARTRRLVAARDRRVDASPTSGPRSTSGDEPDGLLYAVNKEYATRDRALADGDEVALIPPVSGGAFLLTDEPLSLDRVVDEVRDDEAGAIATFTGTTRVHSRGRTVLHLDYEAYEGMAERVMAEIADGLHARYELRAVAIHHRIGRVGIGETSVVIAVSAAHRAGRARRVQGRDRRAEGTRAALEERGLRRAAKNGSARAHEQPDFDLRDYRNPHPAARHRLARAPAQAGRADRRGRRSRSRSGSFVARQVRDDLHRRRRLRADLGLEVRARARRADLRCTRWATSSRRSARG